MLVAKYSINYIVINYRSINFSQIIMYLCNYILVVTFLTSYKQVIKINVLHNFSDGKYEPSYSTNGYKIHMKLTIRSIIQADYGNYKCVSKNSLGDTDGTIQLFGEFNFLFCGLI